MEFKDAIRTREQLRAVVGEPSELVSRKTLTFLDHHCEAFIARSPFLLLASADEAGRVDVSPKGDPLGFVKVLDRYHLAVPDRPGNRRADSMENILANPGVGLIFLVPGKTETLRVSGEATIVRDRELLTSMAVQDRVPELAIVVRVEEAFFHCSRSMVRSKLWQPDAWPSLDGLPRLAETMVDAAKQELSEEEVRRLVENDEPVPLY